MISSSLDNLGLEILLNLINFCYPLVRSCDNEEKYLQHSAIMKLYGYNHNNVFNIRSVDDIKCKDKYMKENRKNFLDLLNKTGEILMKESFDKPYLEKGQFDKIVVKYNLKELSGLN